jgi:DNA-directed RNA polymerase subunit RPC12/RpoP
MASLNRRLRAAARADNWARVIHRCAWCKRLFDENGAYRSIVAFDDSAVATDGMCPPCGARALEQLAQRFRPLAA